MYDLQEPFRWLVDLSVIQAFDSGTLKLHDFFTGIDYRYRFEAEAKQRFIDLIRERFNAGVSYHTHEDEYRVKATTSIDEAKQPKSKW